MFFDTDFLSDKKLADISLEVTDECNLKCSYCFNQSSPSKTNEIPISEIRRIIDDVVTLEEPPTLSLTGGEIFLRNDWEEIAKYATSRRLEVAFATNGVLLTDDIIDKLRGVNVKSIQISIFRA